MPVSTKTITEYLVSLDVEAMETVAIEQALYGLMDRLSEDYKGCSLVILVDDESQKALLKIATGRTHTVGGFYVEHALDDDSFSLFVSVKFWEMLYMHFEKKNLNNLTDTFIGLTRFAIDMSCSKDAPEFIELKSHFPTAEAGKLTELLD